MAEQLEHQKAELSSSSLDLEQLKSMYPTDKFSLYSTDTEERIMSVDKGLERCAGLIRSLIDEKFKTDLPGGEGKGRRLPAAAASRKGKLAEKYSRKGFRDEKKCFKWIDNRNAAGGPSSNITAADQHARQHPQSHHNHPHHRHRLPAASSTPNHIHGTTISSRAKTKSESPLRLRNDPLPRNMKDPLPRNTKDPLPRNIKEQPVLTRDMKEHLVGSREKRNLPREGRGGARVSETIGRLVHAGSAEELRNIGRSLHHRARTEVGHEPFFADWRAGDPFWGHDANRGKKAKPKSGDDAGLTSHQLPPPPPPLFHPYYHPYAFPPCIPPYPFPYYLQFPPPDDWSGGDFNSQRNRQPKSQADALDLATLHRSLPYPGGFPMDFYGYYRDYFRPSSKEQQSKTKSEKEIDSGLSSKAEEAGGDRKNAKASSTAKPVKAENPDRATTISPTGDLRREAGMENLEAVLPDLPVKYSVPVVNTTVVETETTRHLRRKTVKDLESLESVLSEILVGCEKQVQSIRSGSGSLLVGVRLEEIQHSLKHCMQELHHHCSKLALDQRKKETIFPGASVASLHTQVQQLQQERTGLVERIKESCSDYSEARRALEISEHQRLVLKKEVERGKKQVEEVQTRLDTVTIDFGKTVANLKMTEEEVSSVKVVAESAAKELRNENAALQEQMNSLYEEKLQLMEKMAGMSRSLETAKDEVSVYKLAVTEKSSQLLLAEDKILGLRQCLAVFISDLSKANDVRASHRTASHEAEAVGYCVSVPAVKKLKVLADDGNIESFLASSSTTTTDFGDSDETESSTPTLSPTAGRTSLPPVITITDELPPSMKVITPLHSVVGDAQLPSSLANVGGASSSGSGMIPRVKTWTKKSRMSDSFKDERNKDSNKTVAQTTSAGIPTFSERPGYDLYALRSTNSSRSSLGGKSAKSSLTSASEIDFRNNLASLDADIARLQLQFQVARQQSPKS